jgi:hypothetical protein
MGKARQAETLVFDTDGACMRPWLWPGGKLEVQRCGIAELRLGDIAVWFDGKQLRSHRVVQLSADSFVTRGDLMAEPDPRGAAEQLVGKAVRASVAGVSYDLDRTSLRWLGRLSAIILARALRLASDLKGGFRPRS